MQAAQPLAELLRRLNASAYTDSSAASAHISGGGGAFGGKNGFHGMLRRAARDPVMNPEMDVVLGRTPCRSRVFGGHTDFIGCGGYLINMAGDLEMLYIGQRRADRQVILRNMNPEFPGCEFTLDDWDVSPDCGIRTLSEWDRWCSDVEAKKKRELRRSLRSATGTPISEDRLNECWRERRERSWQDFVKGVAAYLQTALGNPAGKKFDGFTAWFSSGIPTGWGLSSSSALVLSTAQLIDSLYDLALSRKDLVELGFCEHYNGTTGGINDHASIVNGIEGKILLFRSFPEEIVETASFPAGISLFLVDSGVKRSQAPGVSAKLRKEGVTDPAVILARTGIGYAMASLWIAHHFPEYCKPLRSSEWGKPYGLLRELNSGGKAAFESDEARTRAIYRILEAVPERIGRTGLLERMPEHRTRLEALFAGHPEPAGGYRLRGMALYGLAENERSMEYLKRANEGNFAGMQELMRISQNGDRIVRYTFSGSGEAAQSPFRHEISNQLLVEWGRRPDVQPLWRNPGTFERSIEQVDYLCDLVETRFAGDAAARVSAAGLGGAVTILAKEEAVKEIREFLAAGGFLSIPPLVPSAGASILSI